MPISFRVTVWIVRVLLRVLSRWQVEGRENIPLQGPLIIVVNHIHLADPILVGASIPRMITFMVKEEVFQSRLLGSAVRWYRGFPVRRGQVDRKGLRKADSALREGLALCIFPEGTRSLNAQLQQGQSGAAFVAMHSGALILPVGIVGTEKLKGWHWLWQRPKLTVSIGYPFRLPSIDGKSHKAHLLQYTDLIMGHIAARLPAEYRGVYGKGEEAAVAASMAKSEILV